MGGLFCFVGVLFVCLSRVLTSEILRPVSILLSLYVQDLWDVIPRFFFVFFCQRKVSLSAINCRCMRVYMSLHGAVFSLKVSVVRRKRGPRL